MNRRTNLIAATAATTMVFALLGTKVWREVLAAGGRIGVALEETDAGVVITDVVAGNPADRAGLRAGDLWIGVEDQEIRRLADVDRTDRLFRRAVPIDLEIARDGASRTIVITPGVPFRWTSVGLSALACLCYLGLGLLAFGQAPADQRIRLLWLFSIAAALEIALPPSLPAFPGWPLIANATYLMLSGVQIGLMLHLASVLPREPDWMRRSRALPVLYYVLGLGLGFGSSLVLVADAMGVPTPIAGSTALAWVGGWGLAIWSLAVVVILAHQLVTAPTPRFARQAALVLGGVVPWAAFNLITRVALDPDRLPPPWFDAVQQLVLLAFPIAVVVAVFKYHLFDMRFVARRSLALVLVTAALATAFYAAFVIASVVFRTDAITKAA